MLAPKYCASGLAVTERRSPAAAKLRWMNSSIGNVA